MVALTLMTAAGEILECSESLNSEIFQAARLHLGALGVILSVTIQCVPAFHIELQQFPQTLTEVQYSPSLMGAALRGEQIKDHRAL